MTLEIGNLDYYVLAHKPSTSEAYLAKMDVFNMSQSFDYTYQAKVKFEGEIRSVKKIELNAAFKEITDDDIRTLLDRK